MLSACAFASRRLVDRERRLGAQTARIPLHSIDCARRALSYAIICADRSTSGCSGRASSIDRAVVGRVGSVGAAKHPSQSRAIWAKNSRIVHTSVHSVFTECLQWAYASYSRAECATEIYITPGLATKGYCERERDPVGVKHKFVLSEPLG